MSTGHPQQCTHVRLATSDVGEVAVCTECGVVNIVLPFMTLRIPAENFADLAAMLSGAQINLLALPPKAAPEPLADALAEREPRLH